MQNYMREGSFPGYLKTGDPVILRQLLDDILLRGIESTPQTLVSKSLLFHLFLN